MAYPNKQTDNVIRLGKNTDAKSTVATNAASTNGVGIQYLATNPKHYEIQRSNNFMFYVDLDGVEVKNSDYASTNGTSVIQVACSKAFVPHFKQDVITIKRGNNAIKFAGAASFDSGSIDVRDYIGSGAKDLLMAWQRLSYDVATEKVGLTTDYKKDAFLLEYTPDYQLVRSWKLHGCWISAISEGEYSHESNDARAVQVTIEYDWAEVDAQYTGV